MHAAATFPPTLHILWLATTLFALTPHRAFADAGLAEKSGCVACHSTSVKILGPSFREIAVRYAGDAQAVSALRDSIRNGGSGKWGAIPMPPQAGLSEAGVKKLAAWIAAGAP